MDPSIPSTSSAPILQSAGSGGSSGRNLVIGVCCMAKKSGSKPMKNILERLVDFHELLKVVIFNERMILEDPIETWPICDCLVSFHSKGFPIEKAIAYAKLRAPYVLNDLERQFNLLDRTKVYEIMQRNGVEVPRYAVLRRDASDSIQGSLVEGDDHIEVNGVIFNKPFVEKPTSAEDHNINFYFPSSAGGGAQKLFRKVKNRSSVYEQKQIRVRSTGSYLYEDFMPTDGTDVKVYAVGPYYAHAEARKSPGLDGKVERDENGKEIRYPVILTNSEKQIARRLVLAFKQTVCGFDLLRSNGKSCVCDVNGFSFVKSSVKYYDDSARILGNMIMRRLASSLNIAWTPSFQLDDPPLVSTTYGKMMELRCVLAVIRHGDRTPKQKMKMEVRDKRWFELFRKYNGFQNGELKLKRPHQLQEVLDIARELLSEATTCWELHGRSKMQQLKMVLEMYGYFSGINRKVQLKYQPSGRPRRSSDTDREEPMSDPSLLLVLKWGGELTPAGRTQAEEMGKAFRCLYPGGQGQYGGDSRGLGFLRLHSTYRHDLKIYASDEGRVQMTAAAFAKGLLALEGELTPILVQMVKSANTNGLLDDDYDARKCQGSVKKFLHNYIESHDMLTAADFKRLNPLGDRSVRNAMEFVGNPRAMCERIYGLMEQFMTAITAWRRDNHAKGRPLYLHESIQLAEKRWLKLIKDFRRVTKEGRITYDISKIPDIYDCVKFDLQHNSKLIVFDQIEDLYICAKHMADIVVLQEYGITKQEKLMIGQGVCTPLLKKIRADLKRCIEGEGVEEEIVTRLDPKASQGIAAPLRHVRTRLYFTSESHIHSLMNVLRYGDLIKPENLKDDHQWARAMTFLQSVTEFNYMAQLVMMLYEDTTKDPLSDQRFHLELHFSPGALPCIQTTHVPVLGYRPKSRESDSTEINTSDLIKRLSKLEEEPEAAASEHRSHEKFKRFYKEEHPGQSTPVNIVSVNKGKTDQPITNEELARHSPKSSALSTPQASPAIAVSSSAPMSSAYGILKSHSDILCNVSLAEALNESKAFDSNNYNKNVVQYLENTGSSRLRGSYAAIKHHTFDLLRHNPAHDKLISTAVINGYQSRSGIHASDSVESLMMSTAVIPRGNSAPDLMAAEGLQAEDGNITSEADGSDVSFFVPPLRSLETLHNQLSHKEVDEFLERIITLRTPIPSPPKTPLPSELSRENSVRGTDSNQTAIRPTSRKKAVQSEGGKVTPQAIAQRLAKLNRKST